MPEFLRDIFKENYWNIKSKIIGFSFVMNFDIMFKDTLNREGNVLLWRQKTRKYYVKPDWLKIKLNTNENYTGLKKMMREKS